MYAYELGRRCWIASAFTTELVTYHQNYRDSETYLEDLEALQYDMLYGKRYIYEYSHSRARI